MKRKLRTGLIGCGNIGRQLAAFLDRHPGFSLESLSDSNEQAAAQLASTLSYRPGIVPLAEAFHSNDVVVECAGREAVMEMLSTGIPDREGLSVIFLSSGGLLDALPGILHYRHTRFLVPSGAVAGLDAIRAVAGEIRKFRLTTTKPAASLVAAPYVRQHGLNLDKLKKQKVIFEGNIDEAVTGFPENINVAATLCLAARTRDLRVRIIADPHARFNTHQVYCSGSFGSIRTITRNKPSSNPKTSQLAIVSTQSLLLSLQEQFRAGS